jgi:hypothetical protein
MRETFQTPERLHPFDAALLVIGGPVLLDAADAAFTWALARTNGGAPPKVACNSASRPAVGVLQKGPGA